MRTILVTTLAVGAVAFLAGCSTQRGTATNSPTY